MVNLSLVVMIRLFKYIIIIFILLYSSSTYARYDKTYQSGVASYYGQKLWGHRTSSGEIFNPDLFTAAHHTLPIGTYVLVTSHSTHKSIVVRINDRGEFWKWRRIIDLSEGAAGAIGIDRKKGIDVVDIVVLRKRAHNIMRGV